MTWTGQKGENFFIKRSFYRQWNSITTTTSKRTFNLRLYLKTHVIRTLVSLFRWTLELVDCGSDWGVPRVLDLTGISPGRNLFLPTRKYWGRFSQQPIPEGTFPRLKPDSLTSVGTSPTFDFWQTTVTRITVLVFQSPLTTTVYDTGEINSKDYEN